MIMQHTPIAQNPRVIDCPRITPVTSRFRTLAATTLIIPQIEEAFRRGREGFSLFRGLLWEPKAQNGMW